MGMDIRGGLVHSQGKETKFCRNALGMCYIFVRRLSLRAMEQQLDSFIFGHSFNREGCSKSCSIRMATDV